LVRKPINWFVFYLYLVNGWADLDGTWGVLGKCLWGIFLGGSFWCRTWVWHRNGRM